MEKRIKAAVIDWGIILMIAVLLSAFLPSYRINDFEVYRCGVNLFVIAFFVIFKDLLFRNASLGKRLMGLQICQGDSENRASVISIIKRNIILIVPIVFYIECYKLIKEKTRLADTWFNTKVV